MNNRLVVPFSSLVAYACRQKGRGLSNQLAKGKYQNKSRAKDHQPREVGSWLLDNRGTQRQIDGRGPDGCNIGKMQAHSMETSIFVGLRSGVDSRVIGGTRWMPLDDRFVGPI